MSKKSIKTAPKTKSFHWWKWALPIVILAVVIVAAVNFNAPAEDTLAKTISVAQAAEMRDGGAFVLDVRELSEWNEIHVPGATLIPLGELSSRLSEVPRDQPVVVMCRSGNRSQEGRDILLAAGFENVTSMAGGIIDWRGAGYETVSGQ